jgi:hypothetical protein
MFKHQTKGVLLRSPQRLEALHSITVDQESTTAADDDTEHSVPPRRAAERTHPYGTAIAKSECISTVAELERPPTGSFEAYA